MSVRQNKPISVKPVGLFGLCFRNSLHNIVAISAIPMGAPGCPEFALLTASRLRTL